MSPYGQKDQTYEDNSAKSQLGDKISVSMQLPKMFNETWGVYEWNIGYGGLQVRIGSYIFLHRIISYNP